jgi:NADPH2:quinone reductase
LNTMKAVGLARYLPIGDEQSLQDLTLPRPEAQGHDLLVRVDAVSMNPVDAKQRAPKDKVENPPRVLGFDAAGVVEAVGDAVTLFRMGDRVWYAGAINRQGSNAQYQLVDERIVGRAPESLTAEQAAALPLTAITAWELLFDRLSLRDENSHRGRSLLVIGGAGGVGSVLVQLARWAGLRVIATASRPDSVRWLNDLGVGEVIDHREPLRPQLEKLGLREVDFVICAVEVDDYWTQLPDILVPQGEIGLIVNPKGPLPLAIMKDKSIRIAFEMMFTRSEFQTPDMIEQHRLLTRVAQLVDAGIVRTTVSEVVRPINAANLRAAHAQVESKHTLGKIVLAGW